MSYLEKSQALQAMIGQGKSLEALDQFYHDNVVVVDGGWIPAMAKKPNVKPSLAGLAWSRKCMMVALAA